jgi:type VI secretion system secreted protein VgrG
MGNYTQADRPLAITTPLGQDALLLEKLSGVEAISELFAFQLELLAEQPVPFDRVLGQTATLTLAWPDQPKRYISGIINRFSQDGRVRSADGQVVLLRYQAELVPRFWLLTKRVQSRIFQHLSIPDILKQVLKNEWHLDVTFQILGTYPARDYCVQYHESDFAFVSRLMEDEGIFYYFVHTADNHTLVVSDSATIHPELPGRTTILYDELAGGHRQETHIHSWRKSQELRACKVNLWDYCFELPTSKFEALHTIPENVSVGQSTHAMNLQVAANNAEMLQILDYPGGYAKRFDGINKGGGEQPAEIQKIFKDNQRTAKIRMEQEAVAGLAVEGASDCAHFLPGHYFNLNGHFFADGRYLLTRVSHEASLEGAYATGRDEPGVFYTNHFHGIPLALPYRPLQVTPKPTILGTQTAIVTGPKGEEIFTDKYGRVKVQFHWDRHGKHNADSSCWVRVAQPWAGGNFGAVAIPRVGHEVVVGFEDGDPDQPIILGCVYNARQMPPFKLPDNRMCSGMKSNAVGGNPAKNFSGLAFNDKAGDEHVSLYAEKDMMLNAENNHEHHVGNYQHAKIGRKSLTVVGGLPGISGGGSGGGGGPPPPPPPPPPPGASGTTQEGDTVQGGLITSIGQPPDRGYGNWKTSDGKLAAVPGFSGGTVYGINSQDTAGFMHQITIGQATQLVVDLINA